MNERPQRRKLGREGERVRVVDAATSGSVRLLTIMAAVSVLGFAAFLLLRSPAPRDDAAAPRVADEQEISTPEAAPAPAPRRKPLVVLRSRSSDTETGKVANDDRPEVDAAEYIAALRASGETGGLAAFPPPGTNPPKTGIVVPDEYQLPEGYARHYQTTDDGRRLEPILALSPGYELVDEQGNSVALGKLRIVPPEFAPPDLPVRILEIPDPNDSSRPR